MSIDFTYIDTIVLRYYIIMLIVVYFCSDLRSTGTVKSCNTELLEEKAPSLLEPDPEPDQLFINA